MKKSVVASLAGVAAIALLSACSPTASTAAVAGGVPISEQRIDQILQACEAVGVPLLSEQTTRSTVVVATALGDLSAQGAMGEEFTFSDEQLAELLQGQIETEVLNDKICGGFFKDNARFNLGMTAVSQLGDEEALKLFNSLMQKVELNPRYGRLKMQENGQIQADSGSMSKLVS